MKKYYLTLGLILWAIVAYAADGISWSFRLIGDNTGNPAMKPPADVDPGLSSFSR